MNFIKTIIVRVAIIVKDIFNASVNFVVAPFTEMHSAKPGLARFFNFLACATRVVMGLSFIVTMPQFLVAFSTTWLFYALIFTMLPLMVRIVDIAFSGESSERYNGIVA